MKTICWDCQKACGKCPWSREFREVKNWIALPTKIKTFDVNGEPKTIDSFIIMYCPLFEKDISPEKKSINEICDKYKINVRTYYRWKKRKFIDSNGKILNKNLYKKLKGKNVL